MSGSLHDRASQALSLAGSTVVRLRSSGIVLVLKTPEGETTSVKVPGDLRVDELWEHVEQVTRQPFGTGGVRLRHGSTWLTTPRATLDSLGVGDGAVIEIVKPEASTESRALEKTKHFRRGNTW